MGKTLYWGIELPNDEPVAYVGCYVMRWGQVEEPTMAFYRDDEIREIEALRQQNKMLVEALKAVEWIYEPGNKPGGSYAEQWVCPNCANNRSEGHSDNCSLAAALKKVEDEHGAQT